MSSCAKWRMAEKIKASFFLWCRTRFASERNSAIQIKSSPTRISFKAGKV
jgi:hypothetical protein